MFSCLNNLPKKNILNDYFKIGSCTKKIVKSLIRKVIEIDGENTKNYIDYFQNNYSNSS